jgi:hypothetical protein
MKEGISEQKKKPVLLKLIRNSYLLETQNNNQNSTSEDLLFPPNHLKPRLKNLNFNTVRHIPVVWCAGAIWNARC